MASQRLTDDSDGGGQMTGTEVVDGNVNNLFPDISRWDRVYGRVSMRKGFVHVNTDNNDTYNGAHIVLSRPAEDPRVKVCMFVTGDENGERAAAMEQLESYVIRGPRTMTWLWDTHPVGSMMLQLICIPDSDIPDIGDVLCLAENIGQTSEKIEYVRLTSRADQGTVAGTGRRVVTVGIASPLQHSFSGYDLNVSTSQSTNVFQTNIAAGSHYYGVATLTQAAQAGDLLLRLDSIFTNLVPATQGETPMVDLEISEAGPVFSSGQSYQITLTGMSGKSACYVGRGIARGSLTVSSGSHAYTDAGDGILREGSAEVGSIDYGAGLITLTSGVTFAATVGVTSTVGVRDTQVAFTWNLIVPDIGAGNNYVSMLRPPPLPGTLIVDFIALGKWYRLRDDGNGILVPDAVNTGTGTVNYNTGGVIITAAAIPDAGSLILLSWGAAQIHTDLAGVVSQEMPLITATLPDHPVEPGTVKLSFATGSGTATAQDDGNGNLTGGVIGIVNYTSGIMSFRPAQVPSGDTITASYDRQNAVAGGMTFQGGGLTQAAQLPDSNIVPGSLSWTCSFDFGIFSGTSSGTNSGGSSTVTFPGPVSSQHAGQQGSANTPGVSADFDAVAGTIAFYKSGDFTETWQETIREVWIENVATFDASLCKGLTADWHCEKGYITKQVRHVYISTLDGEGGGSASGRLTACTWRYTLSHAAVQTADVEITIPPYQLNLLNNQDAAGYSIQPSSVLFTWGSGRYIDRDGQLMKNPEAATGIGAVCGAINYQTGDISLDVLDTSSTKINVISCIGRGGRQTVAMAMFRTPTAPVRPGSFTITGVTLDGRQVVGQADQGGYISGNLVYGSIDQTTGIVKIWFGDYTEAAGNEGEGWFDGSLVFDGDIFEPVAVVADTLRYGFVGYTFIPLDPTLLGLDTVRLPTDGRVPIFRVGDVVVVCNAQTTQLGGTLTPGQVITLPRAADSVEIYDSSDPFARRVTTDNYTHETGSDTLTIATTADFTGLTPPFSVMHKIEDMRLLSDVQINGQVSVSAPLKNAYTISGSFVSTALAFGDLKSRSYNYFDQQSWSTSSVWQDTVSGNEAPSTYDTINYPITTTNAGAVNERWALVFDTVEHFSIRGEHRGTIGNGYISQDCAPLNPATNQPYFFIDRRGWGSGWAAGNAVRFNTEGALAPVWFVRTTLQGEVTEPSDYFRTQIRGDAR